jgi:uncharacterized membrane protein
MDFINRLVHALTELHPLHPMLVHFPIALSGAAAFFILLAIWRKNAVLEQVAFANLTLTFFGALAAGLTGLRDNYLNYDGAAPNAMFKIMLASLMLLITGITTVLRWRDPGIYESRRLLYVSAYLISFALALVLAFLGGVILYGF